MALSARLHIGNNEFKIYSKVYDVVECRYQFNRHHNAYFPDTNPICNKIKITLIAPSKENLFLYEWYIDQSVLSGKISFDLTSVAKENVQQAREIAFEEAECFSIAESYDIDQQQRRLLKLEIIAKQVVVENVGFDQW